MTSSTADRGWSTISKVILRSGNRSGLSRSVAQIVTLTALTWTPLAYASDPTGAGDDWLAGKRPPPPKQDLSIAQGDVIVGAERVMPLAGCSSTCEVGIGPLLAPRTVHDVARLGIDYAAGPRVTLGAAPLFSAAGVRGGTNMILGVAPRIGYVGHLSQRVAFWPRFGLTYHYARAVRYSSFADGGETSDARPYTATAHRLGLTLDALFVFTVVEHAGVALNPVLEFPLEGTGSTSDWRTAHLGLHGGLVAWF